MQCDCHLFPLFLFLTFFFTVPFPVPDLVNAVPIAKLVYTVPVPVYDLLYTFPVPVPDLVYIVSVPVHDLVYTVPVLDLICSCF